MGIDAGEVSGELKCKDDSLVIESGEDGGLTPSTSQWVSGAASIEDGISARGMGIDGCVSGACTVVDATSRAGAATTGPAYDAAGARGPG